MFGGVAVWYGLGLGYGTIFVFLSPGASGVRLSRNLLWLYRKPTVAMAKATNVLKHTYHRTIPVQCR